MDATSNVTVPVKNQTKKNIEATPSVVQLSGAAGNIAKHARFKHPPSKHKEIITGFSYPNMFTEQ